MHARWLTALAAFTALAPGAATAQAYVDDKPAAVEFNGKAYVAMNRGGQIHLNSWSDRWSGWETQDGWLDSGPALSTRPGTLDMFAKNGTTIFHRYMNTGGGWSGWGQLGGCASSAPASTSRLNASGQLTSLDVVVRDCNGHVAFKLWAPGEGWVPANDYISLDDFPTNYAPTVMSPKPGELAIYAVHRDDKNLYQQYWNGSGWSGWIKVIDGALTSSPTVINEGGRPTIFARNSAGDVVQTAWLGSSWMPWANHGRAGGTDGVGAMKASNGSVNVYTHEGSDAYGKTYVQGSGWTAWGLVDPNRSVFNNGATCSSTPTLAGSTLGISLGRNVSGVLSDGRRLRAFDAVADCFRRVTGATPSLRMQIPIDAARTGQATPQLTAFKQLLQRAGGTVAPVISVMSHDFSCTSPSEERDPSYLNPAGAAPRALASCDYPSPAAYNTMLREIKASVDAAGISGAKYTAWNEPDHEMFVLYRAKKSFVTGSAYSTTNPPSGATRSANASYRAGQYWVEAAKVVGAGNVLAGEFASGASANKSAFDSGVARGNSASTTPQGSPQAWALHPYADMSFGQSGAFGTTSDFAGLLNSKPLWLTELGTRIPTNGSVGNTAPAGDGLRRRLGERVTKAYVYHLSAVEASADFDSGLVDTKGNARPVLCGIGGLDAARCTGSNSFGQ